MDRFDNFIYKANKTHNGFYLYTKVDYKNAREKVVITCPIHGDFEQLPYNHLLGKGCNKCSIDNNKKIFTKKLTDFINQSNIVHDKRYDYNRVYYINDGTKVDIICPDHGIFSQTPNKHLRGQGCPNCKTLKTKKSNIKKYSDLFNLKSSKIHNNFYDYSDANYIGAKVPINIICPKHGLFKQLPYNHLLAKGCPKCNQSIGEKSIERYLIENEIKYEAQKKFNDCRNILPLSFDFWLPDINLLIEFDGIQHYKPVGFMNGDKKLEYNILKSII